MAAVAVSKAYLAELNQETEARAVNMLLSISEILQDVDRQKKPADRVARLQREWNNFALKHLLRMTFDPSVKFLITDPSPRLKPHNVYDQQGRLYQEAKKMYLFMEGGNPNLSQERRDHLYTQVLESLDVEDSVLVQHIVQKTLPYKNITKSLVDEAFPGLV